MHQALALLKSNGRYATGTCPQIIADGGEIIATGVTTVMIGSPDIIIAAF